LDTRNQHQNSIIMRPFLEAALSVAPRPFVCLSVCLFIHPFVRHVPPISSKQESCRNFQFSGDI